MLSKGLRPEIFLLNIWFHKNLPINNIIKPKVNRNILDNIFDKNIENTIDDNIEIIVNKTIENITTNIVDNIVNNIVTINGTK